MRSIKIEGQNKGQLYFTLYILLHKLYRLVFHESCKKLCGILGRAQICIELGVGQETEGAGGWRCLHSYD